MDEDFGQKFVAKRVCKDRICKECRDGGGVCDPRGVEHWLDANVRNVVEVCDDGMEGLWSLVAVSLHDLRAEVTEDDDSRLIWSDEDGSDE